MTALLRNANPYTALLLLLYALLTHLPIFLAPLPTQPGQEHLLLYKMVIDGISKITFNSHFLIALLAALSVYLQALYINTIAHHTKLTQRTGYVVAFTYLSFTALMPDFGTLSVTHLMAWLLLYVIHQILKMPGCNTPRKSLFNAAFALSCLTLLQFSGIFFLPLFVLGILILRQVKLQEWLVALFGFITPIYFFASALYLTNSLLAIKTWPMLAFNLPKQIAEPTFFLTILIALIILGLLAAYNLNAQFLKMTIDVRRKWMVVHLSILCALASALFAYGNGQHIWLLPLVPYSLLAAHSLLFEKKARLNNFTFYFIIALVIFTLNFHRFTQYI